MNPKKYIKALVPIVASVLAAVYIGLTGGDPDQIAAIASEWEVVIGGLVTAIITYVVPNRT